MNRIPVVRDCSTDGCTRAAHTHGQCLVCYGCQRARVHRRTLTPEHIAAILAGRQRQGAERKREKERQARAERSRELAIDRDPRVRVYRKAKKKAIQKTARIIDAAKLEFDTWLANQVTIGKGGRPRRMPSLELRSDPRDALIHALNGETVSR
jgi:hypothetical protein